MSWATKLIILSYHLITTANITVLKMCSNVYTITTVASGTMLPSYERAFMLSATCNVLDGIGDCSSYAMRCPWPMQQDKMYPCVLYKLIF